MTSNAIAAMRLQEEKRHNREVEDENKRSRRSELISSLLGSTLRGLGTGVLGNIMSRVPKATTISARVNSAKGGRK